MVTPSRVMVSVRGFVQVFPVSVSTAAVASHHYPLAFCSGFLISFIWWRNVGANRMSQSPLDAGAYGLGAACGTVTGALFADLVIRSGWL